MNMSIRCAFEFSITIALMGWFDLINDGVDALIFTLIYIVFIIVDKIVRAKFNLKKSKASS